MTATVDNAVADLQRVNAELQRQLGEYRAERDEAFAQQTATAEVLGVINSSPGDLAPVFQAILEKAHTLCGAAHGTLTVVDGEFRRAVATHGMPEAFAEVLRQPFQLGDYFEERLRSGDGIVHIADITAGEFSSDHPIHRAAVDLGHVRTLLMVPLRKEEVLLGYFTANPQEVRPFSDKQIALLQNFAAQAVIAMENARLITETREALEWQTATAEVLGVINSSPGDLAPVFDAILEKAHTLCGVEYGALQLYDGEKFRAVAMRGLPVGFRELLARPYALEPDNPLRSLLDGGRLVQLPDVLTHHERRRPIRGAGWPSISAFAPCCSYHSRLMGLISAGRKEVRPFSDQEIALLENFAAQAVIAMENARLITETREALEQQTATAEGLVVTNSSPGDLAPVFDAMLDKATRLCAADFGILLIYEEGRYRAAALHNVPPAYEAVLREPIRPGPKTALARVARGEPVAQIADIAADEELLSEPMVRGALEIAGFRTVLAVPLRKEEAILGAFTIYRQEVRPFSDKQIVLLQNFAAQAVIAMENARLLGELRARTDEIAGWNRELEARVAAQLAEIERTGKLRRFLAPQLADLIVAQGDESILESHRREIVVVFCDLRGFTGFAERAEPEEGMALLRDYHAAMGPIVAQFEGTIDHYGGDGIMVFFNDPLPTPDPARRAIDMAVAMRERAQLLLRAWRRHGHDIGFGVGISQGYATLGQIGFAERMDYTAIGTVTNLAARLCGEARDGQILVSRRVAIAIEDSAQLEEIGDLSLKGQSQAVAVYNVPQ
jgi:class 3 adenylate cyclase